VNGSDPSGDLLCEIGGDCGTAQDFESNDPHIVFQCSLSTIPGNDVEMASYGCGGPIISGSLRPGSTADEARAAAEASGYSIPSSYVAEPAVNGKGWVFREAGSIGNANIVRVGESDLQNPTGYARYYNSEAQPTNIYGSPRSNDETHLPLNNDEPNGDSLGDGFDLSYANSCSMVSVI